MAQTSTKVAFLRYALVGVVSNASGYLVYLLLTWLGAGPKSTMTLLYGVGAALGYWGNRQWAFSHRGKMWKSLGKYVLTHLAGYAINFAILFTLVDQRGYSHQWVQGIAVVVVAAFLFVVFKFFVFPPEAGKREPV